MRSRFWPTLIKVTELRYCIIYTVTIQDIFNNLLIACDPIVPSSQLIKNKIREFSEYVENLLEFNDNETK